MASRSKKKKTNLDNKPKYSQTYYEAKIKQEKLHNIMPFIMLVSLLLIAIFFFLPLTGLNISVDPSQFIGSDPEATPPAEDTPKEDVELSSSVNSFSIIITGLTKKNSWVDFLSNGLIKGVKGEFGDALTDSVTSIVNSNITPSQGKLIGQVMDMQLYISLILVLLWLSTIIVSAIMIKENKSILSILILSFLLTILSIVEFITLITVALGGMAGASFTVNVGAYLLPIVCITLSIILIKIYIDTRKYNKTIKDEEAKLNETMSSLS